MSVTTITNLIGWDLITELGYAKITVGDPIDLKVPPTRVTLSQSPTAAKVTVTPQEGGTYEVLRFQGFAYPTGRIIANADELRESVLTAASKHGKIGV